ncbi:hypothetical protein [Geopsychrobacter electrodiphilus]|uniref:hypothetical protein n=1 Tax=Geopsychrobacter electrodiphilus TaxID=225196 RepID=UPI00036F5A96|nr:hypothetical protein [Geopsychrobacter electrodiphilus]
MRKSFCLYWLVLCLMFFPVHRALAAEQGDEQKKEPKAQVSAEDQQVIAHLELLQQMDMLKDLNLLSAGEEKK